jgi:hypothetical protein
MRFGNPPDAEFTVDITASELAFYRSSGFLRIERVTTDDELDWLRSVYDALLAEPRSGYLDGVFDLARPYGSTEQPRIGQLLFPERLVPEIRQTNLWRNARRISAKLLELPIPQIESWGHLIFKSPRSTAETPWHQDEAYWDVRLSYQALGTWTALDDVDTENGCLWFVPGSHTSTVLEHRHLGGDPTVHVLELAEQVDTSRGIPVPLKAGGMTIHHARTLHYAGPNGTDRIRRAWANEFQSAPVERAVPADHKWWYEGMHALKEVSLRRG